MQTFFIVDFISSLVNMLFYMEEVPPTWTVPDIVIAMFERQG